MRVYASLRMDDSVCDLKRFSCLCVATREIVVEFQICKALSTKYERNSEWTTNENGLKCDCYMKNQMRLQNLCQTRALV